jgi:nitroimidazol reductase NimA-like FMN-containing flavoprotein (pyridoxamine 5'-phosphate oxidase superfamily)
MRREIFRVDADRALALLARAPFVHLATTTSTGAPVLRALDAAVLGDAIYFHGARTGEKAACIGRPAVVSAEEVVARVPSWMLDPERACPATTLFRSVQVHGTLTEVVDLGAKASALESLMKRWQPEGRHRPIEAEDPYYRRELAGVLVFAVPFERVDGKWKLLQNRTHEEISKILRALRERGAPGDAEAIDAIREANPGLADEPGAA